MVSAVETSTLNDLRTTTTRKIITMAIITVGF
jgi:hypothetical protein